MGIGDKIKHAAEELKGKSKEAAGNATNNENLVAEGQNDAAKANVKQAGDNLKDGDFKGAADNAKDAFDA